jgi:3-oxoacyl-[acyl-carrier protein] reductase
VKKLLKDKIALITGASRGIGFTISKTFIENGAKVIGISYDEEELKRAKEKLGENFITYKCDVTKEEEVVKTINSIKENIDKIDILVNNAGITSDNFLIRMKEEQFMKVIDVNLKGTFLFSREVAKIMRKQKQGSIINISSVVGIEGNMAQANYSASKAGVIGLTKSMSKELTLKGEQIRVNAIAPGFIKTDMTEKLNEKVKDHVVQNSCLKKMGESKDVANLALFLASDLSSYITGEVIRVDGGLKI